MFRSRRSTLVKRLWKSRACTTPQDEATCPLESQEEVETRAVIHSMLKRLKERQLEALVQAVESQGGEDTDCVLLPKGSLRLGRRTVAPHVVCCQVWRWPSLESEYDLKRLPQCSTTDDPSYICCNPYHWSCRITPDTPPPPYSKAIIERVILQDGPLVETVVESTETGLTPTAFHNTGGSVSGGNAPFWCNLAYWEHRQRVGRLFTVCDASVNVFQQLPHGGGMCLAVLQQEAASESVRRTREKIGFGLTLSKEPDGVWVYNRSDSPIFVNSPTLDVPNSNVTVVTKVPPSYSMKIFDYTQSEQLERTRQFLDGPYDPNSIRISFAKGWGPCYSRQFITSCPCWLEVLLRVNR